MTISPPRISATTEQPSQSQEKDDIIQLVCARLLTKFPSIGAAHIEHVIEVEYNRFSSARVRTYIPVLVEHNVRQQLQLEHTYIASIATTEDSSVQPGPT